MADLMVTCDGSLMTQIKQSVTAAVAVHQPDLVLVLGDQFDEGSRPTPDADWQVRTRPLSLASSSSYS